MTNTLIDSIESALQSLIISNLGASANVYTGKAASNIKGPAIICAADGDTVEEDPKTSGNFWVNVTVSVKHTAATEPTDTVDPRTDDTQLVKAVFDIVRQTNLDALLNVQGQDLTVFPNGAIFSSPKSGRDELGVFIDELPIRLYCCPSVLAP